MTEWIVKMSVVLTILSAVFLDGNVNCQVASAGTHKDSLEEIEPGLLPEQRSIRGGGRGDINTEIWRSLVSAAMISYRSCHIGTWTFMIYLRIDRA